MAYDMFLAERVRHYFEAHHIATEELAMMGGLCFMVDAKMCCGVLYDKKSQHDVIMARIGIEAEFLLTKDSTHRTMDFTGGPMKGFVFVLPDGYDLDDDLDRWLDRCMAFNPLAKASKKLKKPQ